MRKFACMTLGVITALALIAPAAGRAAEGQKDRNRKSVHVIYGRDDLLEGLEDLKNSLNGKIPGVIVIPGNQCQLPGQKPEQKPDTDKPVTKPEETPDTEQPEETPEQKPDTDKPVTKPEETPDTEQPEEKPEQQPDEDKPETEEPESPETLSFAHQVVKLVNEERAKAGLSPLQIVEKAEAAAAVRAKEIETSFSHTRPNGSSFSTALKEQGVSFRGSGENIAWGQKTPEAVMNAWMNSPGHRANILNRSFTGIGVGYQQNSRGVGYWTQLFIY